MENISTKFLLFQKLFEKEDHEYRKYSKLYNLNIENKKRIDRRIKRLYKICPYDENDMLSDNFFLTIKRIYMLNHFSKDLCLLQPSDLKKIEKLLNKNVGCMDGGLIFEMKRFNNIIKKNVIDLYIDTDNDKGLLIDLLEHRINLLTTKLLVNEISIDD